VYSLSLKLLQLRIFPKKISYGEKKNIVLEVVDFAKEKGSQEN
jgi:hypothetical protein